MLIHRGIGMVQKRSAHGSGSGTLREPLHWGAFEICSSALYIGLSMLLIAAVALGVLELIGFGALTHWHDFSQVAITGG